MKICTLLACLVCLPFWAGAQEQQIDISGTVASAGGTPIEGASVELLNTGLSSVTDANGRYSIGPTTPVDARHGHSVSRAPRLSGHFLEFEMVSGQESVSVGIYSLEGRRLFSVIARELSAGRYKLGLGGHSLPAGLYCVRARIGNSTTVVKLLSAGNLAGKPSGLTRTGAAGEDALAKHMSAMDTLRVSAPGYDTQKKQIPSYTGIHDFILQAKDSYSLKVEVGRHLIVTGYSAGGIAPSDFDYLAAVPAAAIITGGRPAVLAAGSDITLSGEPWFADYLARYRPEKVYTLNGPGGSVPGAAEVVPLEAGSARAMALKLAEEIWNSSEFAVLVPDGDYGFALQGAALAALLKSPMLFATGANGPGLTSVLEQLKVQTVLVLGDLSPGTGLMEINLTSADEIAVWVSDRGMQVDYLAAANPADLTAEDGPRLSLSAPLLAARRGGLVLPISNASSITTVLDQLKGHYEARGGHPRYLAIVGSSHTMPVTVEIDPMWPAQTIETDYAYSDIDTDEFPDIAIGRIIANNGQEASLLVSRTSTWDHLCDGTWDGRYVETGEWVFAEAAPLVENYGLQQHESLLGTMAGSRERVEAGIIFHYAHSDWTGLGGAFNLSSTSLISPGAVFSRGCSVAGIVQAANHRYITKRLFKLGIVAFVGAPRTATAAGAQVHVQTTNRILAGESIGEAYKSGIASLMVNLLDNPGDVGARRETRNNALYGDPALVMNLVLSEPGVKPAAGTLEDGAYEIVVPAGHFSAPLNQALMTEWKWTGNQLYVSSIPGITPKTSWSASGYDSHKHVFTAEFTTDRSVESVVQQGSFSAPLGMAGAWHVDEHKDNTRTILWNVRVQDFNNETNTVINQAEQVNFNISYQ